MDFYTLWAIYTVIKYLESIQVKNLPNFSKKAAESNLYISLLNSSQIQEPYGLIWESKVHRRYISKDRLNQSRERATHLTH